MTPSLRFILTCSLLAVPLAACGDDKGTSDSQATATQGTGTDGTTTDDTTTDTTATGTTTDDTTTTAPTTDDPTTGTTTTPGTTTMSPGTTDDTTTMPGTTTDDTTDTGVGPAASFAGDIYPIIMANCSCHVQGAPAQLGMPDAMTAYTNLVDVPATQAANNDRVAPGDPATSYLVAKLKGLGGDFGGNPSQMPLNSPPLSDGDIALIEDWIADGAQP